MFQSPACGREKAIGGRCAWVHESAPHINKATIRFKTFAAAEIGEAMGLSSGNRV